MGETIKTEKKQWEKPELIVILRSKPEEAVLASCKGAGKSGSSGFYFNSCSYNSSCSAACSTDTKS